MVGSEEKIECLTHMYQRVSDFDTSRRTPVIDLAAAEMPALSRHVPKAPFRKPSLESTDSFDFSEIDQMANRIGGECFTPDATTEQHIKRDPLILSE